MVAELNKKNGVIRSSSTTELEKNRLEHALMYSVFLDLPLVLCGVIRLTLFEINLKEVLRLIITVTATGWSMVLWKHYARVTLLQGQMVRLFFEYIRGILLEMNMNDIGVNASFEETLERTQLLHLAQCLDIYCNLARIFVFVLGLNVNNKRDYFLVLLCQFISPVVTKSLFLEAKFIRYLCFGCIPFILIPILSQIMVAYLLHRSLLPALDKEMKLRRQNSKTLSILYHGMKNFFAAIGATAELLSEEMRTANVNIAYIREVDRLRRLSSMGVVLCNSKRTTQHIMGSRYTPMSRQVNCADLLSSLACLSRHIKMKQDTKSRVDVDPAAVYIILENAITNAERHKAKDAMIKVTVEGMKSHGVTIVRITNRIPNNAPKMKTLSVPPAFCDLNFDVSSINDSPSPSTREVRHSRKKTSLSFLLEKAADQKSPASKFLSEGKGSRIITEIARKCGYGVDLRQVECLAVFQLALPTSILVEESNIKDGKTPKESGKKIATEARLRVCCIDDMHLILKQYRRLLVPKYFAKDSLCVGDCYEEVASIAQMIVSEDFDCVLVDQHLVYDKGLLLGTDIIREARESGYQGVMMVRSGNMEEKDRKQYIQAGADGHIGKDATTKQIYLSIKDLYDKKSSQKPTSRPPKVTELNAIYERPTRKDLRSPISEFRPKAKSVRQRFAPKPKRFYKS